MNYIILYVISHIVYYTSKKNKKMLRSWDVYKQKNSDSFQ